MTNRAVKNAVQILLAAFVLWLMPFGAISASAKTINISNLRVGDVLEVGDVIDGSGFVNYCSTEEQALKYKYESFDILEEESLQLQAEMYGVHTGAGGTVSTGAKWQVWSIQNGEKPDVFLGAFDIREQPESILAENGTTAVFHINASGQGLSYQWQKSTDFGTTWVKSSSTGANTDTLSLTAKMSFSGYYFRCVVTGPNGEMLTGNIVVLVVRDADICIWGQPVSQTVKANDKVQFIVTADGTDLKYQWKKSTDGGKTWVNSASTGANTDCLTMTAKMGYDGYMFKCEITDESGTKVTTGTAKLTVKSDVPVITGQPTSQKVAAGASVAFQVTATGDGLTYQWQKSTDGGKTWMKSSSTGATTNKLQMTTKASYNNLKFRCVVTNSDKKSTVSNTATLTVTNEAAILTQPKAVTAKEGAAATFQITAAGEGLTYQWQKSTDGGKTWVNSSSTGAKTASLSMTAKYSYNGLQFRCTVTDKNGKKAVSNAVGITVLLALNETNFPDAKFRSCLKESIAQTVKGYFSPTEISKVKELFFLNEGIESLAGIEYFTSLTNLDVPGNKLTSIDVSKLTKLTVLNVFSNRLTSLDLSKNTELNMLECSDNRLTALNVSYCKKLEILECDYNRLKTLNLSANLKLRYLSCTDNNIQTLDLSKQTGWDVINISYNPLYSMKLSAGSKDAIGGYEGTLTNRNIVLTANKDAAGVFTYDLSKMPSYFDLSKVKKWTNATVSGTTLKVTKGKNTATYLYDCGDGLEMECKLYFAQSGTLAITEPVLDYYIVYGGHGYHVSAVGDGLTYQWQKSTDGGKTWVNSSSFGAKTDRVTVRYFSATKLMMRCILKDKNGKSVTTEAVTYVPGVG